MGLEFVNPQDAPPPAGNYSNLAIVPAGYRLLVIAGQIGNLADGSIVDGLEAQYEQAIQDLDEAIRLNPEDGRAYYNRGISYEEMGKTKEAERDFAKAKELGVEDGPKRELHELKLHDLELD